MSDDGGYFPPAEEAGGWRRCAGDEQVRELAGMDPERLELVGLRHAQIYSPPWALLVVRHGYVVREWYAPPTLPTTTFDVWSCTKSFTGTAFGLLLDDSRNGRLAGEVRLDLDSRVYELIPEGQPLSDPRKADITLRHLLSMTSGIRGEGHGFLGIAPPPDAGPFEVALGKTPDRFGRSAALLAAEPGEAWEYSDNAFAQLSLLFARVAGREIHDYLDERVFDPLGVRNYGWDVQGGGGFIGPHTNAHTGLRLTARDMARFGHLLLRKGRWHDRQLVPSWWLELATRSSQELNPDYGYTFWLNSTGQLLPGLPRDTLRIAGYAANRCLVIPSLDMVVVRLGYGPESWSETGLLEPFIAALVD